MVQTPVWSTATPGLAAKARHPNQFLGTHQATYSYTTGAIASQQATGNGVYESSQTTWLSQTITTTSTQTGIGYLQLQLSTVGGSPTLTLINPLTVSLYNSVAGQPSGSALISVSLASQYVYSSSFWVNVPLSITGLSPSTAYEIVTQAVGTTGHYYTWQHSTGTGAATSTNGTTWTNQTYGLMYKVYNTGGTGGNLIMISEDNGARWTQFVYNSNNLVTQMTEFTAGETPTSYLLTTSNYTYTNGLLTAVS